MKEIYYCSDCGQFTTVPDTYEEKVGEFWGSPAYETFLKCPVCGGCEISEATKQDMIEALKEEGRFYEV